ncbi:MAG TPA: energy transducer TonB [Candidatus Acidoferrales bacterium]|nr:energy transducer TonB [Candidatus Acidoferrales bacterium]
MHVTEKVGGTRRYSVLLLVLTVLSSTSISARSPKFVSPVLLTAGDIPYPVASIASGIVSVTVNLDAAGQLQSVQVLRDIPSLTSPTVAAIKQWTFAPGKLDDNPVPSSLNVSVVFNPAVLQTRRLALPSVQPAPPPHPQGYLPPEISAAFYANYPPNSVATGAVVLNVVVGDSDQIRKVSTIRAIPSLTSQARAAVNAWSFNSATFQGKAIESDVIIGFVFRSPAAGSP